MIYNDGRSGFLTTIIGPMFSEKSGELIKRCLLSEKYQGKKVVVYKPSLDDRYSKEEVVSRIGLKIKAHLLDRDLTCHDLEQEVFARCRNADIVAFDEAQFFSKEIIEVVERLVCSDKQVIVAGLNLDYLGRPFGFINSILLFSDEIVVKSAFCRCCGRPAMYTQRLVDGKPFTLKDIHAEIGLIGDTESYEPRCRLCFVKEGYTQ